MICVFVQSGNQQSVIFENKISAIMNVCEKKHISFARISSLDEVQSINEQGEKPCIVLFGFSSRWIFSVVEKARILGINVIVAGYHTINAYSSVYSGVCYDQAMAITDVFTYLDRYKKTNVAVYGISPSIEEQVWSANLTVKFMPWRRCDGEQVFPLYTTLEECWKSFSVYLENFNAVICPNDLVAISLIQHIKSYRPSRLHDIFIISLEETVLGKIYSPSITSLSCNDEVFALKIVDIYSQAKQGESCQVNLKRELKTGASTDNSLHFAPTRLFTFSEMVSENIITFDSPVVQVAPDTEYIETYCLNKLFTGCSEYELNLLIILLEKDNYNEMANALGTNPETVKYYIRKCFTRAGLKNKTELKALIEKYISARDLKRYRNANRGNLKKGR